MWMSAAACAGLLAGSLMGGVMLPSTLASAATSTQPEAKAPSDYTGTSPEVSTVSATLKGGLNPHGSETTYYFQYGPTAAYGLQTTPASAGAGTQEVKVAQAIAGLQPNAVYHFRLVATSAAGTALGGDHAFTTKKIPLTLLISAQPPQQMFGSSFSITGTLSGTENANHSVVLQANPFPYLAGFKNVGNPESTNAAGNFAFQYSGLTQNTQLRVSTLDTPPVTSKAVIEFVAVKVTLHVRATKRPGSYLMYGNVMPPEPSSLLVFQRVRSGHRPQGITSAIIKKSRSSTKSSYSKVVRILHAGTYRAYVSVANGRQKSYYSRTVRLR
jgi:hypothetical protein